MGDVQILISYRPTIREPWGVFKIVTLKDLDGKCFSVFDVEMAIRNAISKMGALQ